MHSIALFRGDGIGPEIMEVTLKILKESGARLDIREIEMGEQVYLKGIKTGIDPKTWDILKGTSCFLKAPSTTPQGGGFKSLNVTFRTRFNLYANVRPCVSYAPFIKTRYPNMDVVIIRENEEDLYIGMEYRQTSQVAVSHKMITRPGSEKIHHYAFEYARRYGKKKVSCFTKDNILKLSDGLFHTIYNEVAAQYEDIVNEHWIVDIGAAKLIDSPDLFEVVVLPNLYGDILSDITAQMSGSVGLVPSANIGDDWAMFEAIHGSAPRRAGKNMANPSALLLSSVMMMAYLGESEIAQTIHQAWLCTLEDGIHTYDIFNPNQSKTLVGTREFGEAVIARLGLKPSVLRSPAYQDYRRIPSVPCIGVGKPGIKFDPKQADRVLVGVDVFIYSTEAPIPFQEKINDLYVWPFKLQSIMNRGTQIWPHGYDDTFCIEQMRCRFIAENEGNTSIQLKDVTYLLTLLIQSGYDILKMETLYSFGEELGYSV